MVKKIIIADASPLIAFGRIQQIQLLSNTLGSIIIPEAVANECLSEPSLPGAADIQNAIHHKKIEIHQNPDLKKYKDLLDVLDHGEANAIALAVELTSGILIDEKLGRSTAEKFNLKVIGTAGVLLLAKKNKLIDKVSPLIQQLKKSGYYLSYELIKTVLHYANEKI